MALRDSVDEEDRFLRTPKSHIFIQPKSHQRILPVMIPWQESPLQRKVYFLHPLWSEALV